MKIETKLNLAATAAALLVAGFLCQTANANLLGIEEDATLTDQGPGMYTGHSFVVGSEALAPGAVGNPSATQYFYEYWFGQSGLTAPPVAIASLSVYFNTGGTANTASSSGAINSTDVNWTFNPNLTSKLVDFLSPDAPGLGYISAQDGGLWGGVPNGDAWGVVVPGVPDGGMTMSMLGGALVGLGAIRRKIRG